MGQPTQVGRFQARDAMEGARINEQFAARADTGHNGLDFLAGAINALSATHELSQIQKIVRQAARNLTGCDGATIILKQIGRAHV